MYKIAIVEDMPSESARLTALLRRYADETENQFYIMSYQSGQAFLDRYDGSCDLVLMDIQMTPLDGMETARCLRGFDDRVILIFVTNMAQYALQGYEVEALDFLVKPVEYPVIRRLLDRVLPRIRPAPSEKLCLRSREGTTLIPTSDICYVESYNHKVIVHTPERDIPGSETLQSVEAKLRAQYFFRCHAAFLVNLEYVERIQGSDAWVRGVPVPISKHRKKAFLDALTAYLGDKI